MPAIETLNLTKTFEPPKGLMALLAKSPVKRTVTAVDRITLTVGHGELFGLLGPNGAGKTTFIKMLCTLLWPTSGTASINGHDLVSNEGRVKDSIGFVSSEERSFYWRLTGRQNLQFFAALMNIPAEKSGPRIDEVLAQLGLEDAADNMYYSYSSGMKQKLVLARGLLRDPAVLFLDEPTKSVDAVTAQKLKVFIRQRLVDEQQRTVFLTTHRLEEAEELCDRLAVMNEGSLLFCGTVGELRDIVGARTRYSMRVSGVDERTLAALATKNQLGGVSVQRGEEFMVIQFCTSAAGSELTPFISSVFGSGGVLHSCDRDEFSLERSFVALLEQGAGGDGSDD